MKADRNSPLVTVVIPTFGHRDYVRTAVDSAMAQAGVDCEIVVINDGSPDDTADMLRPLARSGAIQYIEQENQGQAAARNRGLGEASGKYIAFLDDDDIWPLDKLQWQVAVLESDSSAGAVGGSAVLIDKKGDPIGNSPVFDGWTTIEDLLLGNPFLSPGQTLIQTELLRRVGGLDAHVWGADDYDLWFKLARHSRIRTDSRPALYYRKHPGNASRNAGRLLRNTASVIRTHLPSVNVERRGEMRREIYRNLYWWLGQGFVCDFRESVRCGNLSAAAGAARSLAPLGMSILDDPFLWKQVISDLLK